MSDIKLFTLQSKKATEIAGTASHLEKPLQALIEANLDTLLGIRFLASEYSTGKTHSGRIDTLGIDENHCPAILEYKRTASENVINQGLFYLEWLMDHQAEFKLLVLEAFGKAAADAIDWSAPRLICIAADFTKYDGHAVQQINRNIELIRYRRFGPELLLLELVNEVSATSGPSSTGIDTGTSGGTTAPKTTGDKPVAEWLKDLPPPLVPIYEALETHMFSFGDDVQRKELKYYIAYKRLRNFATVVFQVKRLLLFLSLDPAKTDAPTGLTRDVRKISHWGTGDLEVRLGGLTDLEKAKPLIQAAYDGQPA